MFYGWWIVLVTFLGNFVGASWNYGFSVIMKPMAQSLGGTRPQMVFSFTVGGITSAFVGPLVGWVVDRQGARGSMVVSGLLEGLFLVAISRVNAIWQFWLLGAFRGLAQPGMMGIAGSTAVANWFFRRRGRALAIAGAGLSVAGIVMTSVTQYFVASWGWPSAWVMLGVISWLFFSLPAAILVRRRPEDMGLRPDGGPLNLPLEGARNPGAAAAPMPPSQGTVPLGLQADALSATQGLALSERMVEVDWEAGDAMRTAAFWLITLAFGLTGLVIQSMMIHLPSHFTDIGLTPAAAVVAQSMLALGIGTGRISWGFIIERIHIRTCSIICALSCALAMGIIMGVRTPFLAAGSTLFLGLGVGGLATSGLVVYPDYYGRKAVGTIRGAANFFHLPSQLGGPLMAAWVYDFSGSYQGAFASFVVAYLLTALLMFFAKPPKASRANHNKTQRGTWEEGEKVRQDSTEGG